MRKDGLGHVVTSDLRAYARFPCHSVDGSQDCDSKFTEYTTAQREQNKAYVINFNDGASTPGNYLGRQARSAACCRHPTSDCARIESCR